jgi:hypothetical protein
VSSLSLPAESCDAESRYTDLVSNRSRFSVILQQPDICNKNVISADKTRRVFKVFDHPNYGRAGNLGELVPYSKHFIFFVTYEWA